MANVKSIVLVGCWHDDNKGDSAIKIGTLSVIKKAFPLARISLSASIPSSSWPLDRVFGHTNRCFPNSENTSSALPGHFKMLGVTRALRLFVRATAKLIAPRWVPSREEERGVMDSDLVISIGGLYFAFPHHNEFRPPSRLFAMAYALLLAKRVGVPYVLLGHSLGPFNNSMSRRFMRFLLSQAAMVVCREHDSEALVRKLAPKAYVSTFPDMAFAMSRDECKNLGPNTLVSNSSTPFIAVSVRNLRPYGHSQETEYQYLDAIAEALRLTMDRTSLDVLLVAHTLGPTPDEDDREITEALRQLLATRHPSRVQVMDRDVHPLELMETYARAQLVVASRYHAAVLALRTGTPVIAVPYFGTKTEGTFSDLRLLDYVVRLNEIDGQTLSSKIQNVVSPASQAKVVFSEAARDAEAQIRDLPSLLEKTVSQASN